MEEDINQGEVTLSDAVELLRLGVWCVQTVHIHGGHGGVVFLRHLVTGVALLEGNVVHIETRFAGTKLPTWWKCKLYAKIERVHFKRLWCMVMATDDKRSIVFVNASFIKGVPDQVVEKVVETL